MVISNCIVSLKQEETTEYYLHEKKLDIWDGNTALINSEKMTNATKAQIWEIRNNF